MENKYIINTKCSLWDKENDISLSLSFIKIKLVDDELELISFDDIYKYYNEYCKTFVNKMVISKRFYVKIYI